MNRSTELARTGLRGAGQVLITAGVVVLLFCFYELQITNVVAHRAQDQLGDQLARNWSGSSAQQPVSRPVPSLGKAFARLYVPALEDYAPKNIVEGVSVEDLKKGGPGHIPGTALPGQLGNVVLSGHRTTYGAPFNRWAELLPGAQVVLETQDGWFTYTVTGSQIVAPTAVEVTYAVPGKATATPTKRLLTMTTCNPKYSARERLIVSAELTSASSKAAGLPAGLRPAVVAGLPVVTNTVAQPGRSGV